MIRYDRLKEDVLGRYCRTCINERFGLNLVPDDCRYRHSQYQCAGCGDIKRIVVSIRTKRKLLMGKDSWEQSE